MSRRNTSWAVLAVLLASQALAAPPPEFTIQGVLRDGAGALQTMPVSITATVYDAQTAGNKLAGPYTQNNVPVTGGLFTLTLSDASLPALVASAPAVWVELTIGADTFARQKVTTTMFSALSGDAAKLAGVPAANYQRALSTPDCGAGKQVQGVAADGTVTCASSPTADGTSITASTGAVFSVAFAGTGTAPTAAHSDHSHTMSCVQRAGTANNVGVNEAYAQCISGEAMTGGGCIGSASGVRASYHYLNSKCAFLVCNPPTDSWVCISSAASDTLTAYAECCTIN